MREKLPPCNILSATPHIWSRQAKSIAEMVLDEIRPRFICGEGQMKGARFNSNVTGIWALTSTYTEEEFRGAAFTACFNALDYLAGSDHFYAHEKRWVDD